MISGRAGLDRRRSGLVPRGLRRSVEDLSLPTISLLIITSPGAFVGAYSTLGCVSCAFPFSQRCERIVGKDLLLGKRTVGMRRPAVKKLPKWPTDRRSSIVRDGVIIQLNESWEVTGVETMSHKACCGTETPTALRISMAESSLNPWLRLQLKQLILWYSIQLI